MAIFVRSPGSCGEFIQGSLGGTPFLLTCPVNRYSHALADVQHPFRNNHFPLQAKARKARELTLALLGMEEENTPIYVRSDIPQGKGMASSSADIGAVAMATALLKGRELTLTELEKISLAIEPSDATFYPGVVLFDYLKGNLSKQMGVCPPMKIVIFDEGGSVDTVAFNNRVELPDLIREKEGLIEEALYLFELGINSKDVDLIGRASTISSFANQRILPKPDLYGVHEIGQYYGSSGTIIAHSGTIMGLIFPVDEKNVDKVVREVLREHSNLSFLDTVETTNEGIAYTRRNNDRAWR